MKTKSQRRNILRNRKRKLRRELSLKLDECHDLCHMSSHYTSDGAQRKASLYDGYDQASFSSFDQYECPVYEMLEKLSPPTAERLVASNPHLEAHNFPTHFIKATYIRNRRDLDVLIHEVDGNRTGYCML